jgi:hypothetical protein
MAFDRFSIAPFETGLQTDRKPWLIMDDAFAQLNNAYVFRGRVRKRFGSNYMGYGWSSAAEQPLFSRLNIPVGTTDAGGALTFTALPTGTIVKPGSLFSVNSSLFTVTTVPIVVGNATTLSTDSLSVGTIRLNSTGPNIYEFRLVGANAPNALTPVYFYPAEPVMGICNYENGPINNQPTYAFDTRFAYIFAGGFWQQSGTGTAPIWHGTNINFFWTANYRGATPNVTVLFVSNFYAVNPTGAISASDDPIWYTADGSTWTALLPGVNAWYTNPGAGNAPLTGNYIVTARIIIPYKNSLLLLNTIESDGTSNFSYVNRCRFSAEISPFAQNAWYQNPSTGGEDNTGKVGVGGGFTYATTEEAIISAEFIKDRLIVYFERSTWEIVYTGDPASGLFVFQKINTELGSEAQQSTVPFDKFILTIGNTGVHSCNGSNVERIDDRIPDKIFQIVDKNIGVQRVCGIRDYYTEMVYWSFPSTEQNQNEVYPSKVLVFNYKNGAWAFNDDCITAFGYFEQQITTTWASSAPLTWEEADMTWGSGTLATQFRQVVAGNQEGFVFIINSEVSNNAPVMQITNMVNSGSYTYLTIIDHTLNVGDYIYITGAQGSTTLNGNIYKVEQLIAVSSDGGINTVSIKVNITGTYTGGGYVSRVSNHKLMSKQWNPYYKQDMNVYLAKIDFMVTKTTDGEVTVQNYPSSSTIELSGQGIQTGALVGTSILETSAYPDVPLETYQERIWHPVYFQLDGESVQILISMSDDQIRDPDIAFAPFELHAMNLFTKRSSDHMR